MKTVKIQVYNFSELNENAKEKVIENYYESETYDFLSDDLQSYITDILDTKKVFSDIKLNFDFSYSQGDGLSFSADFDFAKFLADYNFQEFKKRALCEQFIPKIKMNAGRYCFASENDCTIEYNTYMSYFSTDLKNLEDLADSILSDIQKYYLSICYEAKRYGYDLIEYRMPEAEFSELCDENDLYFYENGKMY